MKLTEGLYCLHLLFQVTPQIERFVNVGVIKGEKLYLVDTGVAGSFDSISGYLDEIGGGRIGAVLLTHSHPDHIGCAARLKRDSGCRVYGPEAEREWIEDIAVQYKARPIPNFFALAGESVPMDAGVSEGDVLRLEPGVTIEVLETPGHSHGSVSYYWREKKVLFCGDAVPVPGDIPIYVDSAASVRSLEKLLALPDVDFVVPSWAGPCSGEENRERMRHSLAFLRELAGTVERQRQTDSNEKTLPARVCRELGLDKFVGNPLLERTILTHLPQGNRPVYFIVEVTCPGERGEYADYVELVKPIVERHGGVYLVRTEAVTLFGLETVRPDRLALIRFDSRAALDACFSSPEYQEIMRKREENVHTRALIVEGL